MVPHGQFFSWLGQVQTQNAAHAGGECICISKSGVRPDAPWLRPLFASGYGIYCGFDAVEAGETASRRLIAYYPSVQRLRPPQHDWNDVLTAHKE